MLIKKNWFDRFPGLKGFKLGAQYPVRGAVFLWHRRSLWVYMIVPLVINIFLFLSLAFLLYWSLRHFIFTAFPHAWWAIIVKLFVVGGASALFVLLTISGFAFIGGLIAAPFYDVLSGRVISWLGSVEFMKEVQRSFASVLKASFLKWTWFLLLQAVLLVLYAFPFFVGFFTYVTVGFFITSFFLAMEFLDIMFHYRGLTFQERVRWCKKRPGLVLGFGGSVSVLLLIPVINIFVPPAAMVGAILLFFEEESVFIRRAAIGLTIKQKRI